MATAAWTWRQNGPPPKPHDAMQAICVGSILPTKRKADACEVMMLLRFYVICLLRFFAEKFTMIFYDVRNILFRPRWNRANVSRPLWL